VVTPRTLNPDQVEMARTLMANPVLSARVVAEQLGVHRSTLYRSLGRGS
jgi:IS30 family transposase